MQQSFVSFSLALCTYTQMKSLKHTQSFKTLAKVMAISMVPINPKCLHKLHTYAILEKVWKILLQKLPWHDHQASVEKNYYDPLLPSIWLALIWSITLGMKFCSLSCPWFMFMFFHVMFMNRFEIHIWYMVIILVHLAKLKTPGSYAST